MQTWLTEDPYDPAYNIDDLEMESRLTSHMILNTRNASSIYPEDLKDAEIEIYMRNMKHAPKYEMLQFVKFSNNEDFSDDNSMSEKQKDKDFDLNVGWVNPLTNSRLLLSFKLKWEFLDHVAPDFGVPEHLPHSLFDDCSNEIDRILEVMKEKKRRGDSLWAYSPYIQDDGSMVDWKVKIVDYDFERLEFLIEFEDKYKWSELYGYEYLRDQDISKVSKLRKYWWRSNLQLEYESKHEADERKRMVAFRRLEAQNQLNCEKAFINELANKYDYVKMGREMKENIK